MKVKHVYGHDGIYLWNMEYKRQLLRVSCNTFSGYEDPLQRQPQVTRTSNWLTILSGLDELPAS